MTDDLRRRAIAQLIRFLEEDEHPRPIREPRKDKKSVMAAKAARTAELKRELGRAA